MTITPPFRAEPFKSPPLLMINNNGKTLFSRQSCGHETSLDRQCYEARDAAGVEIEDRLQINGYLQRKQIRLQ